MLLSLLFKRHHNAVLVLGDPTYVPEVVGDQKIVRNKIREKYLNYYNNLMWMLQDEEFKNIKIFNWGR